MEDKTDCLVTLNVNGFLQDWVRRRFVDSSIRWDMDYCEVHVPGHPVYPAITKLSIPEKLKGYSRLVYFDADCVIGKDSPNPITLCVDEDTLYAVSDYYDANCCSEWETGPYYIGISTGLEKNPCLIRPEHKQFFNSGMWMFFCSESILRVFSLARSFLPENANPFMEQGAINMAAYNTPGIKVELIPQLWNRIIPQGSKALPEFNVNHYGGWAHDLLKVAPQC